MAQLRLYKRFYAIDIASSGSTFVQNYTLLNPYSLICNSSATDSPSVIVEGLNPIMESTGVYYVDITANLYSIDKIYNINWNVLYTFNAPLKQLMTTFRFIPTNIGGEIEIEILNQEINL